MDTALPPPRRGRPRPCLGRDARRARQPQPAAHPRGQGARGLGVAQAGSARARPPHPRRRGCPDRRRSARCSSCSTSSGVSTRSASTPRGSPRPIPAPPTTRSHLKGCSTSSNGRDQRHDPDDARPPTSSPHVTSLDGLRGLHQGAATTCKEPDDEQWDEPARRGTRAVRHRPGQGREPGQAGPHPSPAPVQGARREVLHAHRLRAVRRLDVRRGRHRRAPGGRLGVQQRLRQRDDGPGHRRRAAAPDPCGQPVGEPGARRRRPSVRVLPGLAGAGVRHRNPLHEGRARALREARGWCRDGAPDHPPQPGRHPRDGAHRVHAAERARPRWPARPGPRRRVRAGARRRPRGAGGRGLRGRHGDGAR